MPGCLRKGTKLAHAVADTLFALPPIEDLDGPIVHLPPPAIRLPREKHESGKHMMESCILIMEKKEVEESVPIMTLPK